MRLPIFFLWADTMSRKPDKQPESKSMPDKADNFVEYKRLILQELERIDATVREEAKARTADAVKIQEALNAFRVDFVRKMYELQMSVESNYRQEMGELEDKVDKNTLGISNMYATVVGITSVVSVIGLVIGLILNAFQVFS